MDFNGLDLFGVIVVVALAWLAVYALRQHRQEAEPPRGDRDDLALARAVRASYDNLPYRNGRGWRA